MAYRNTFFRWLFLYSLTFGLTYVLKLFTYLCPETGQKFQIKWQTPQTLRKNLMIFSCGSAHFPNLWFGKWSAFYLKFY